MAVSPGGFCSRPVVVDELLLLIWGPEGGDLWAFMRLVCCLRGPPQLLPDDRACPRCRALGVLYLEVLPDAAASYLPVVVDRLSSLACAGRTNEKTRILPFRAKSSLALLVSRVIFMYLLPL